MLCCHTCCLLELEKHNRPVVFCIVRINIELVFSSLEFQVVRCFEDDDIVHVNGKVDPKSDIDVINLELIFCDLEQVI